MKKILLLVAFFATTMAYAQDECATAVTIMPSTTCTPTSGTLLNATTSTTATGCTGYFDVFYKFVATTAAVDITLTTSSTLDPKLSVFSTCGSTSLYCVDNGGTGTAENAYVNSLTIGNTYFIKVSSYSSTMPTTPTFSVCVKSVVRPVNDECAGAISLTPTPTCNFTTGTFLEASTTSTTSTGCGGYFDVFYSFVATSTSTSITTTPSSGTDINFSLFTSCGGSALVCVSSASSGLAESQTIDNLTVGATYYVKVATGSLLATTNPTFTICVQNQPVPTPPVNNECSGASTLLQSSTCSATAGTLLGATTTTITPSCSGYKDVFYKFVATATSANIEVTSSANLDATVGVYSSCGSSSLVCVNSGGLGGLDKVVIGNLVVGTTYYIKVGSTSFAPLSNTFTICVKSVPRPVNDNCIGAVSISPSSSCIATSGSLFDATTSNMPSTCTTGNSDVFYKFVAASTSTSVTVVPSASMDPVVTVFSACGSSSIGCRDNGGSGTTETLNVTGLIIGATYFIQVQNYGSYLPSTADFTICVQNTISTVPVNDECTGAIALIPSTTCAPISGTLLNATTSAITTSCPGSKDVFYKFVANATTATVTVVGSSGLDVEVSTFSVCSGTNISCVDVTFSGQTETVSMAGLTIGNTYFIKVQDYSSTGIASTYTFTICVVSIPVTPSNDECIGAVALTPSNLCVPTSGTIANATTSTITTTCSGYYDVFYKFTSTATSATVTLTTSNTIDAVLGVYTSCNATSSLACQDAIGSGISEVATLNNLTIGTQYFIKVSSYWATLPTANSTFAVCVESNSTTTATQSSAALSSISLYPNPTQNVLNIENISASTKVELIDMTGKTVFSEHIDTDTQLIMSNYSAGVYILKLSVDGVSENRRVVISK